MEASSSPQGAVDVIRAQLTSTLLCLKLSNKSGATLCQLLEKHALQGPLENFKE